MCVRARPSRAAWPGQTLKALWHKARYFPPSCPCRPWGKGTGLTSSFLAFSAAGRAVAVLSSELLVAAAWPAGSEAVVRTVGTGAGLCVTQQPERGRLPCRMNWGVGWLTGA